MAHSKPEDWRNEKEVSNMANHGMDHTPGGKAQSSWKMIEEQARGTSSHETRQVLNITMHLSFNPDDSDTPHFRSISF